MTIISDKCVGACRRNVEIEVKIALLPPVDCIPCENRLSVASVDGVRRIGVGGRRKYGYTTQVSVLRHCIVALDRCNNYLCRLENGSESLRHGFVFCREDTAPSREREERVRIIAIGRRLPFVDGHKNGGGNRRRLPDRS